MDNSAPTGKVTNQEETIVLTDLKFTAAAPLPYHNRPTNVCVVDTAYQLLQQQQLKQLVEQEMV